MKIFWKAEARIKSLRPIKPNLVENCNYCINLKTGQFGQKMEFDLITNKKRRSTIKMHSLRGQKKIFRTKKSDHPKVFGYFTS